MCIKYIASLKNTLEFPRIRKLEVEIMQPETRPAEETRPQKAAKSSITARKILALIAAGIVLALVISLCISIAGTSRIRTAYANSRNAIGYALYENLQMLIRSYDDILLAGADIEGSILPTMKEYFLAAQTLDSAIWDAYGEKYSILSGGTDIAFQNAFQAFDDAFRQGKSTADAVSNMSACVQSLDALLATRYTADFELLPA